MHARMRVLHLFGIAHLQPDLLFRVVFGIAVAVGALFTLLNVDLPVARNALVYEKAALGIVETQLDVHAVVRTHYWTSGKPILFPLLAAPFVGLFGANAAVVIASAVGTIFFLWMTILALGRMSAKRVTAHRSVLLLAFVFVAFNPLVAYQFWSAYPDSLIAGLILLAFVLTDIIARNPARDTRWHMVGLGFTIALAIHTKLYGAILGPTCLLYLGAYRRSLLYESTYLVSKVAVLGAVFLALALFLLSAKLGWYPFLGFDEGAGAGLFVTDNLYSAWRTTIGSLWMIGFALLLTFHAALVFLASKHAWNSARSSAVLFFSIYMAGLLPFAGTYYNMRYFLPAFPLVALVLGHGAMAMSPSVRRWALGVYGVIALTLVLIFNLAPLEAAARPVMTAGLQGQLVWLDNLRIGTQVEMRKQIESINANVPEGGTLYWSSQYYGEATFGLAHSLGVRTHVDVRYVADSWSIPRSPNAVYLTEFTSAAPADTLSWTPTWGTAEPLGSGVFRLDPFYLACLESECSSIAPGGTIRLKLHANQTAIGQHVVSLFDGRSPLALDPNTFELELRDPEQGVHDIVARTRKTSASLTVFVGTQGFERTMESPYDYSVEVPSGDIMWVYQPFAAPTGSTTALRFSNIAAPRGAHVRQAYLDFPTVSADLLAGGMELRGELRPNPPVVSWASRDISSREHSQAVVSWNGEGHSDSAAARTPNLNRILDEIFAQGNWAAGSSIMLLLKSTGAPAKNPIPGDPPILPRLVVELESDAIVTPQP